MKSATSRPWSILCMLLIAAASRPLSGQNVPTPPATVDWGVLNQLVGHWIADSGGGHPGATTRAEEVFTLELGGRILVRHDFSEYASANGAQATRHDGLLIFYPIGSRAFAAHSYDNEGHVIDYAVVASDGVITLTSAALAGTPRFRLTYLPDNATMRIRFEIASPGQPEAFQLYVSGTTHRAPQ